MPRKTTPAETMPELIEELGIPEVCYRCKVSPQAVHAWAAGATPKLPHFLILADLAGIPVDPRLKRLAGLKGD